MKFFKRGARANETSNLYSTIVTVSKVRPRDGQYLAHGSVIGARDDTGRSELDEAPIVNGRAALLILPPDPNLHGLTSPG